MKRHGLIVITCLIACSLAGCGCHGLGDDYVPYVPVERRSLADPPGGPAYWESPDLLTPEHTICIQAILKRYREAYVVRNGKVHILGSLQENKELLYNYGLKADDLSEAEAMEYLRRREFGGSGDFHDSGP